MKKILFSMVLSFTLLSAGERIVKFSFDPAKVKLGNEKGYVTVNYEDFAYLNPSGFPMLPSKGVVILVPANSNFAGFDIVRMETKSIGEGFKVFPQQKPVPISYKVKQEFAQPDPKIYSKDAFYPASVVKFSKVGVMGGFRLASFTVYPIIYNPVTGELKVVTHLELRVKYNEGKRTPNPITVSQFNILKNQLKALVSNPEDIEVFSPPFKN